MQKYCRVVTRHVLSMLIPFSYANFWSLIPKERPILVLDPTNMVQPDPWSLKKLLIPIPWSVIPDPRAAIPDPTLLIPDPTHLIPDPIYLVTTLILKWVRMRAHFYWYFILNPSQNTKTQPFTKHSCWPVGSLASILHVMHPTPLIPDPIYLVTTLILKWVRMRAHLYWYFILNPSQNTKTQPFTKHSCWRVGLLASILHVMHLKLKKETTIIIQLLNEYLEEPLLVVTVILIFFVLAI